LKSKQKLYVFRPSKPKKWQPRFWKHAIRKNRARGVRTRS
jgi:hypothetical protein